MAITLTAQTSGSNYNNKIKATWTAPSDGNRGIADTNQTNPNTLPKLEKYSFEYQKFDYKKQTSATHKEFLKSLST